jgi:arylsulfatase A-like enzyme
MSNDRSASDTRIAGLVLTGISIGLASGWLAAAARLLLQAFHLASFDRRLTVVSPVLFSVSPITNAILLGIAGFVCGIGRRVLPRAVSTRLSIAALGVLGWLPVVAASGRVSYLSEALLSLGLGAAVMRLAGSERPWRRALPWIAAVTVVSIPAIPFGQRWLESRRVAALPPPAPGTPNVLLVVIDTLRADHLPTYGYSRNTTPGLAQLAAEGAQFDWAIAASSWTLPTHASLLTGYYPSAHGAIGGRPYDNRFPTLPSALAERGYRTAAVSANTQLFSRAQGFGAGFSHFDDSFFSLQDAVTRTVYGFQILKLLERTVALANIPGRRGAEDVTRAASAWLDEPSTRPFFLMLNYFDAHDPHLPLQPWRRKFSTKPAPGGKINSHVQGRPPALSPAELQDERDAYDGSIAYIDYWIGELLRHLQSKGLRQNTLVIVTADHGESFGEHGEIGHGLSLYLETIHVPLIVVWPGHVPAGTRVDQPVSQTSIPGTILQLVGGSGSIHVPGGSLAPIWEAGTALAAMPTPVSELAQEHLPENRGFPVYDGSLLSVFDGRWHYIEHSTRGIELYDTIADPGEELDVAPQPSDEARRLFHPLLDGALGRTR